MVPETSGTGHRNQRVPTRLRVAPDGPGRASMRAWGGLAAEAAPRYRARPAASDRGRGFKRASFWKPPDELLKLFRGKNFGNLIVELV